MPIKNVSMCIIIIIVIIINYYLFVPENAENLHRWSVKWGKGTTRLQYLITQCRYKEYLELYLHSCYAPSYQDVDKETA
jgi:hypothetical protein